MLRSVFLWFIVLSAALAAVHMARQPLLELVLRPGGSFEPTNIPAAPNYHLLEYWAAHPLRLDASDLVPLGETSKPSSPKADVFYIHPTGYIRADNWNSDMSSERGPAYVTKAWLALQASAFNRCCRVFAPEYRQAALSAFVERETDDGLQALELAYSDVLKAFDHYLAQENQGRPFIIVSHSQGTAHALRLLQERIEGSELARQLVAAYLIGYQLPLDSFDRLFVDLQPCQQATATGCIISWDTFRQGSQWVAGVPHWYGGQWEWSDGKKTLCTNPLSWRENTELADVSLHLGALPYEVPGLNLAALFDRLPAKDPGPLPAVLTAVTGAQCSDNGELYVSEQTIAAFRAGELVMGAGNYHISDFSLFYKNIQSNAQQRVEEHLRRRD